MNQSLFLECKNKNASGKSWNELAEKYSIKSGDTLRGQFRREMERIGRSDNKIESSGGDITYRESEEIKQDGTIISDRLIKIRDMDSKNPASLMEAHGFDSSKWTLISCKNNYWNGMRPKDAGLLSLYQSKITVKPKTETKLSFSDIDNFFSKKIIPYDYSLKSNVTAYDSKGMVLEINLADLHIGNIGVGLNNEQSVYDKVNYVIKDILLRVKNIKLKKIILVQNGDILNFDTKGRTTTSMSHTVTTDGSTNAEMFDEGARVLIYAIDELEKIASVDVVGIYGNHDAISSYMLMKSIEFYYRNNKNIFVDAGHSPRKFRKFGNNLVFWQHGDMSAKNIKSIIQREARKEFGETKFAEIHLGNYHHQQTLESDGIIIRYLPSIAPTDEWHLDKGYTGAIQSVVSFLWDLDKGLREMWFSSI